MYGVNHTAMIEKLLSVPPKSMAKNSSPHPPINVCHSNISILTNGTGTKTSILYTANTPIVKRIFFLNGLLANISLTYWINCHIRYEGRNKNKTHDAHLCNSTSCVFYLFASRCRKCIYTNKGYFFSKFSISQHFHFTVVCTISCFRQPYWSYFQPLGYTIIFLQHAEINWNCLVEQLKVSFKSSQLGKSASKRCLTTFKPTWYRTT